MAELKPVEVIMRIDLVASDGAQVVVHAERVQDLVRCKDCKRSYSYPGGLVCSYGLLVDTIVEEDFFCADGERR